MARSPEPPLPKISIRPFVNFLIVRHAERMDFNYGYKTWLNLCFDGEGEYYRCDLNMPYSMPKRSKGHTAFLFDTPITQIGMLQSNLLGGGMLAHEYKISHAYSSPALRCVQTCHSILRANKSEKIPICIDPSFFEYLYFYKEIPDWMTPEELKAAGYNIDLNYIPMIKVEDLDKSESLEDFYKRNHNLMTTLKQKFMDGAGGNILIVGHSATLEACTRQILGFEPREYDEIYALVQGITYCSTVILEEKRKRLEEGENPFHLADSSFLNIKHAGRVEFDVDMLTKEDLDEKIIEKYKNKTLSTVAATD